MSTQSVRRVMRGLERKPLVRSLIVFVTVGGLYAGGSQTSFSWFDADGVNASFFPAAGVTAGALLTLRRRHWPAILAGAAVAEFVMDQVHGIGAAPSAGYAVANVVEPLIGATLALRWLRGRPDLGRNRDVAAFIVCSVVAAPAVGGALGASNNVLVGNGDDWVRFAVEWWVGDGLGVLVVASTIIAARVPVARVSGPVRRAEAVAVVGAVMVTTAAAFWAEAFTLLYVPAALLFVVALRVGPGAVAVSGTVAAFVAAQATADGHTFWDQLGVTPRVGVVYLQVGLGLVVSSSLLVAAALEEQQRAVVHSAEAEQARRLAAVAQARAEALRAFAEGLGATSSQDELSAVARGHGFERDRRRGAPAGALVLRQPALEADETDERLFVAEAERIFRDAAARVALAEAERSARRRAALLERHAQRLVTASTPADVGAATVGELHVAGVEACAIHVCGEAGRVAIGEPATLAGELGGWVTLPSAPWAECEQREAAVEIDDGDTSPGHAAIRSWMSTIGLHSLLVVPVRAGDGSVLGSLGVLASPPGPIDPEWRQMVLAVADQCGLGLDRAGSYQRAHALAHERALLARLSEVMDSAPSLRGRARALVRELVAHGAAAATLRAGTGAAAVVETAAAPHVTGPPRPDPTVATVIRLRARGRNLGTLEITAFDDMASRPPLDELAARVAVAIDNARLYEREREVSHTLQLGLLGGVLPAVAGVHLEAAYRPGTDSLEVGGDWYDAFVVASGHLALVVGDVVGHNLDAVSAMAQLRGACRALGVHGGVDQLLERLDGFVATSPAAAMSTVVFVELDPVTGEVSYACAGHPPPLVTAPDGTSRLLWEGRSGPLGLPPAYGAARPHARDRLRIGDRLVLYTDGLIERRGEGLDRGLARLHAAVTPGAARAGNFVDALCDRLLEGSDVSDDVCVLVLEWTGAPETSNALVRSSPD